MDGSKCVNVSELKFNDVNSKDYYYRSAAWAQSLKIAGGYDDGTYRPKEHCTRSHIVTFIYRYFHIKNAPAGAHNWIANTHAVQYEDYTNPHEVVRCGTCSQAFNIASDLFSHQDNVDHHGAWTDVEYDVTIVTEEEPDGTYTCSNCGARK